MSKYKVGSHTIYYVHDRNEVPISEITFNQQYIINEINSYGQVTGGICGSTACLDCPLSQRFPESSCNAKAQRFIESFKIIRTKAL